MESRVIDIHTQSPIVTVVLKINCGKFTPYVLYILLGHHGAIEPQGVHKRPVVSGGYIGDTDLRALPATVVSSEVLASQVNAFCGAASSVLV